MGVKVLARRRSGYTHDVEIEGGHKLVIDEPLDSGGANEGPSPTRTLGAALAACTAITTEMYAERKGWELGALQVEVDITYDGSSPTASRSPALPGPTRRRAVGAPGHHRRQVPRTPRALAGDDGHGHRSHRPRLMDLGLAGRTCVVTGRAAGSAATSPSGCCAEEASVLLVAARRG